MSRSRRALALLRCASTPGRHLLPARSFATEFSSLPPTSQAASDPSLQIRNSITPIVEPIPTSSQYSLDHPFWADQPDPVPSGLAFASDDELFNSLLLPSRGSPDAQTKGKSKAEDWTATFDPSLAFLTLRSRPTYTAFLQCIRPFVQNVYPRLKEADQHQLLVTDLLLRHPDPRLLRDILELDCRSKDRRAASSGAIRRHAEHLRPSLVDSIHSIIDWQIRRGSLARLTAHRAHLAACRNAERDKNIPALLQSWHELRLTAPDSTPETAYLLLTFILTAVRVDPAAAFGMLHAMIKDELLPRGVLLRGIGEEHPKRREIIVVGAVVRSCLEWEMKRAAREHAGYLLDMVLEGQGAKSSATEAIDLVLEVCRGVQGGRDARGLEWCTQMFIRMVKAPRGPRIPAPLFNAWLDAMFAVPIDDEGNGAIRAEYRPIDIWLSLPPSRQPSISAQNIYRLAASCTDTSAIIVILYHLSALDPSTTLHIAVPLVAHVSSLRAPVAERRQIFDFLLHHWAGKHLGVGAAELANLIRTIRADRLRCLAIIKVYEARLLTQDARRGQISGQEALAMVHTYLLVKDPQRAEEWLNTLELSEDVKIGMWDMALRNGIVRIGLKALLRKRCSRPEVNRILAGDREPAGVDS